MRTSSFVRPAAYALVVYGVIGLLITAALVMVGNAIFTEVDHLLQPLDRQRGAVVQSLRAVSTTVGDAAGSTRQFKQSLDGARSSADTAATLAQNTAASFRELGQSLNITIFGLQPFQTVIPRFNQSADQLDQLAQTMATTRDSLNQNSADVVRVGGDLDALQNQIDSLANTLDSAGGFLLSGQRLVPLEFAYYGVCLLLVLQSVFSILAGVALLRETRSLRVVEKPSTRVAA